MPSHEMVDRSRFETSQSVTPRVRPSRGRHPTIISVTPLRDDGAMTKRPTTHDNSEQLTLLTVSELPMQFRLDQRTRERGLAHIAAIRRQLAAKASDAADSNGFDSHKAA